MLLKVLASVLLLNAACKARPGPESSALRATEPPPGAASGSDEEVTAAWYQGVALLEAAGTQYFTRPDDRDRLRIAYARVAAEPFNGRTVLIVPGFAENQFKYSELVHRLHHDGFDVIVTNLRGMGFSDRYPKPSDMESSYLQQIVHVRDAGDYAKDLHFLLHDVIGQSLRGGLVIFAHSTGGLATIDLMSQWPGNAEAVVLNSPLLGLNLNWFQAAFTRTVSATLSERWPPQGREVLWNPHEDKFSGQSDTTSQLRYGLYVEFLKDHPDLIQSLPSRGWIAAIKKRTTDAELHRMAGAFTVPTLLFSAGRDTYVDVSRYEVLRRAIAKDRPMLSPCLVIDPYQNEYHSIWRGLSHDAVYRKMVERFKEGSC